MSQRENGTRCRRWNYSFKWTSDHRTQEQLRPLIFTYDTLGSEALDRLDSISAAKTSTDDSDALPEPAPTRDPQPPQTDEQGQQTRTRPRRDLYKLLEAHHAEDEVLQKLWDEVNTVPDWVDWEQIGRGQDVFHRYAGPSIIGLTFQSLLGGMGAGRPVETLARTGGFGVKVARRRLLETFQHILDVNHSVDSVKPGGAGFASSLRVRLLHASVRRRIMQLAREKPSYYDADRLGVPINDLDSIGTICSFSATLIWIGYPRQGIFLTEREAADCVALWRWVAHLLVGGGAADPFLSTPARARAMMESMLLAEVEPTPTSRVLANNVIAALRDTPPTHASADFLRASARWLNGPELADALAVPRPPSFPSRLYYSALVAAQCLFFMALAYGGRAVPAWDRRRLARARRLLAGLVRGQAGPEPADHAFKYIPSHGLTTTGEQEEEEKKEEGEKLQLLSSDEALRRRVAGALAAPSDERRNLTVVIVAGAVAGLAAWLGFRGASGLYQSI